jgi:hypothetical protein
LGEFLQKTKTEKRKGEFGYGFSATGLQRTAKEMQRNKKEERAFWFASSSCCLVSRERATKREREREREREKNREKKK